MPQYALARHVFVCVQGEHVVFLDVRKDRYFALESARTAGLGCFVPGWPVTAPLAIDYVRRGFDATAPVIAEQIDLAALTGVIALLLEKNILTAESGSGKTAEATVARPLEGDLPADAIDERPRIGPDLFCRFVSAAVRARLLLKYRSFEGVIGRVRHRVRRPSAIDIADSRLLNLLAGFATLRPFFFAAKDACLFDALSLGEFLAGYGVYPEWVFGVQSRPFAAHCWLQLDGVVLNDTVDHVRRYTPIMIV
jgi:transglutaminase superfamily protein